MSVHDHAAREHGGPGYASPAGGSRAAARAVRLRRRAVRRDRDRQPDFIAVVDVDPRSSSYGEIVHRTEMPNVGDELHHFGWNACSSACHSNLQRDTMIVPGFRSSRIHMLDISQPRSRGSRM